MPSATEAGRASTGPEGHAYLFGLGSPHGGDRLGWLAVARLHDDLVGREDITVDRIHQPTDLFLHAATPRDRLLLIDAMRGQGPPGTILSFAPDTLPSPSHHLSSHGVDLASTLALVDALGLFRAGIRIIGIEMASAQGPQAPASLLDDSAVHQLREAVLEWLDHGQQGP